MAPIEYAIACGENEYESCWQVDLGPLGEAKDCKCLPKVGGTVGQAGNEIRDGVANLAREIQSTPEAVQECINDVPRCANEILSAPLAAPVQAYIDSLYNQSEGKIFTFSPEFITLAQPYYNIDLKGITWANDINTGHGMTVAYCDRIFFAGHGNLWKDPNELHHVLHELEHTVQCQGRGQRTYLAEYVLKAGLDVVKTGRLNVHDVHDYEVAAEAKANQITGVLWEKIKNGTTPIPARERTTPPAQQTVETSYPSNPFTPPPARIVQFCQTPFGSCQFPPVMAVPGTPCYCNSINGAIFGTTF